MRTRVELLDASSGDIVEGELFDEITAAHFLETQDLWKPLLLEAKQKLQEQGRGDAVPRYAHWDWTRKEPFLGMLAVKFLGISYEDKLQGIVELQTSSHLCRVPAQKGRTLVYVDYLQAAPWNVKLLMAALGRKSRLRGVGMRLMEAAVRFSIDEDFKGRVGLHSLPHSEPFYTTECGMVACERDFSKQNLLWCEFTPEKAQIFLTGGTR